MTDQQDVAVCTQCGAVEAKWMLHDGAHRFDCHVEAVWRRQLELSVELPEGVYAEMTGGFVYALRFDVSPTHHRLLSYEGDDPEYNGGGRYWVGDYLLIPDNPYKEWMYGEEYLPFDDPEEALKALSDPNPTPTIAYLSTVANLKRFA